MSFVLFERQRQTDAGGEAPLDSFPQMPTIAPGRARARVKSGRLGPGPGLPHVCQEPSLLPLRI